MIYCSNCGSKINSKNKFCASCGYEIDYKDSINEELQSSEHFSRQKIKNSDFWSYFSFLGMNIKKAIAFIILGSVVLIMIYTVNGVTQPRLKGSEMIFIDQWQLFDDPGLSYSFGFEPIVTVTNQPDTRIAGRYVVNYEYKNIFGLDAPPLTRVIVVREIEPINRLSNLLKVLSENPDNNLNLDCTNFSCKGSLYYLITDFSFEVSNNSNYILVSTDYDIPLPTNVRLYYKEGYLTINSCSEIQCGSLEYDYYNRRFFGTGAYERFDLDGFRDIYKDLGDLLFRLVNLDLRSVYNYYN